MKRTFLVWPMLLLTGCVFGQAKEGIVVYKKTHQPATTISLPYEPVVITAAMDEYFLKMGVRSKELKGFKVVRSTQFVQGDPINADLYFKVTRNSRSNTGASIIYLMVGMENEDIKKRKQETHFTRAQAKEYLNNLVPVIEAYDLELLIKQQNETVIKEEEGYNRLVEDGVYLNKRKNANEQKLQNNQHDQDKQNEEVEKQKRALDYLISQRNHNYKNK